MLWLQGTVQRLQTELCPYLNDTSWMISDPIGISLRIFWLYRIYYPILPQVHGSNPPLDQWTLRLFTRGPEEPKIQMVSGTGSNEEPVEQWPRQHRRTNNT